MHSREFDSIWLVPMKPLASLFARYCASRIIWPGDVERDRVRAVLVDDRAQPRGAVSVIAGVHGDGLGSARRGRRRTSAVSSRPGRGEHVGGGGALGAQPAEVGRMVLVSDRLGHVTPAAFRIRCDLQHHAAADAAVGAHGVHGVVRRLDSLATLTSLRQVRTALAPYRVSSLWSRMFRHRCSEISAGLLLPRNGSTRRCEIAGENQGLTSR